MHDCDRVKRNVPAIDMLRKGCNPYDGSPLMTRPRRLCKRDVGSHSWSGEGRPDDNLQVCCSSLAFSDNMLSNLDPVMGAMADPHADEDDPLGLGVSLG